MTVRPLPESLGLPLTGVDSHAHLDDQAANLPALLERARRAGVAHIGQVFLGPEPYAALRPLMDVHPELFFLMAVHPNEAASCTGASLAAMRTAFAQDARLRAVGETGLDLYWKDCPLLIQETAFRLHLALAVEAARPVVIHSRDAASATLRILEDEGFAGRPLLWHCFSGDAVPELDRILANGWHVSIPGPVSYPANADLREAAARVPADRLLLETDSPYLAPVPWRGKPNEPALVAFTAQTVATARDMDLAELWTLCGANAVRFFGI